MAVVNNVRVNNKISNLTLNFPVRFLLLVSKQYRVFHLSHDTERAPRRKEHSKTLVFLHCRFNKTHRHVHTQEMRAARAVLSNTQRKPSSFHFL